MKAITVRFHLSHPAEKQAWEKLRSLQNERHQSFSQLVAEAVNTCGTESVHLSCSEKNELVQEITEAVASRLQQMLPAYLAGYSAGASAPVTVAVPSANAAPSQAAPPLQQQESDDAMPDFGDSCMDFDFIGG